MSKIRIATVKATGQRYIVNQLDFRAQKAHLWGEVIKVVQRGKTLDAHHEGEKTFALSAVDIAEVDRTSELLHSLFHQHVNNLRAQGNVITGKGKVLTNHGTPEQHAAAQTAKAEIMKLFGHKSRPSYREPIIVPGNDAPIPEKRSEILGKIVDRLTTEGPHLQRYSNGEFTTSSLAVGLTFDACKSVKVLEAPEYTIHHDKELGLYWRRGGSWD